MQAVRQAGGRPVVVVNAAEGEPASRKDRTLIAQAPQLVVDGGLLAAQALDADEVVFCTHRSGPQAATLRDALAGRPAADLGGRTAWVQEIPSRYVSSEASALVSWLNGRPGKPTFAPPRTAQRGIRGRPTLVQNAETMAHLALVARHGAQWFRTAGTDAEPGTFLATLAGAVGTPGVYEVEFGTPLPALLARAGGTTAPVESYLVGGYFGRWLPAAAAERAELSVAGLRAVGGALGAGVIVALPSTDCGLAATARLADYLAGESAGQCGPCINGLPAIAAALRTLTSGPSAQQVAERLHRWLGMVGRRGACSHPDGFAALVGSALDVFADEVQRHRRAGHCGRGEGAEVFPIPRRTRREGWR